MTSVLPGRSPNVGGQGMEFFAAAETEAKPDRIGIQTRVMPIVERTIQIAVTVAGERAVSQAVNIPPLRPLTIYILPHSHTDIGYTAIQTDIEEKQINNLLQGLAAARRTADYPQGARFVWNVEVAWAADLFLQRMPQEDRDEFLDAVRRGQIALNGMYLNELTGLCRPAELVRLFRYATQLGERTGVPVDAAMISDVPGYTWGTVTAMAQAGIKYFSVAPNYFDRIGTILVEWENKPFWWMGPDGESKVLVWIPFWGYAMSHRYGDVLPRVRGDWTPYWEDGAGSSAAETALNRASSERLAQAETLWAMLAPRYFPTGKFEQAWNNVLLYSEHTWGAHCSISQPANPFTTDQWNIKQSYATAANLQSRQLLSEAAQVGTELQSAPAGTQAESGEGTAVVDIFNTTSWPRTEVVLIPHELSAGTNFVTDDQRQHVPAQRLASQELAVLVRDLPPLSGHRYRLARNGKSPADRKATASGAMLANENLRVRLDERTGGVIELRATGLDVNLVDTASGHAANDYLYLIGDDVSDVQRNGPVTISVRDRGPLVASLLIESEAPGCHKLSREVRLVAGGDYVELLNTVDKSRLVASSYHAREGKESVNFAFPLHVPGGTIRLDVPLGVIRPEQDQMPSACKNWLTAGRWADISNSEFGVSGSSACSTPARRPHPPLCRGPSRHPITVVADISPTLD